MKIIIKSYVWQNRSGFGGSKKSGASEASTPRGSDNDIQVLLRVHSTGTNEIILGAARGAPKFTLRPI